MAAKPEKSQSERFIEAARALSCDEDEAAFDAKLAVLARRKPKPAPKSADHKSETDKAD